MCNATVEPRMVLEDRRQVRRQRRNVKDCRWRVDIVKVTRPLSNMRRRKQSKTGLLNNQSKNHRCRPMLQAARRCHPDQRPESNRWAKHLSELFNSINSIFIDLIPQLAITPDLDQLPTFHEVQNNYSGYQKLCQKGVIFEISKKVILDIQNNNRTSENKHLFRISKIVILDIRNSYFWWNSFLDIWNSCALTETEKINKSLSTDRKVTWRSRVETDSCSMSVM